jgi:ATP-dependent helicase/nuclease subunit A
MSEREASAAAQQTAANPDLSAWVTASAGTGKTRVLIDRILNLLLAGTLPGRILCLTFTKAAAAEMEIRLSRQLSDWAAATDEAIANDLRTRLGGGAGPAAIARARRLFADTVEAPEGLKIRTIHSFCESLLGRFPLEAGIAPHFKVADDRTTAELMIAARDHVLLEADRAPDQPLGRALAVLSARLGEQDFADLVRAIAAGREKFHALFAAHGGAAEAAVAARYRLGVATGTAADSIARACQDGAFNRDGLLAAARALAEGSDAERKRALTITAWLAARSDLRAGSLFKDYQDVFVTGEGTGRKNLAKKETQARAPDAVAALEAERARMLDLSDLCRASDIAESTEALLQFAHAFLARFDRLKDDAQLLDYDDLIFKAQALLERDGGISWVHFKLDGGIDHILVDEAQDTSPAQWEVIRLLAEEFFAGEGARERTRTLFAVGDPKQSIYSFQGADPDAFARMRSYFESRVREAGGRWQSPELALSFRSTAPILGAVDDVFAPEEARAGLEPDGRPIRHVPHREGAAGLVELWDTEKPEAAEPRDAWDAPLDRVSASAPSARLARRVAAAIARWIATGDILPSLGRAVRAGDIMVLVPKRGPFVDELIRTLKRLRVPVAGADRLVLASHIAVMDLIAMARVALLPEDDLTLATVLKSPLIGLDDDALIALAPGRTGTLLRALELAAPANPEFARALERLNAIRARADFKPPFEFFAELLGPLGGRLALVQRLGPDAADPIDEFLAAALAFEREHVPSLEGFLHWLEAGATEIKRDAEVDRDEVRVMTAHGAKGLQANIVILPDTARGRDAKKDSRLLWSHEGQTPVFIWGPSSKKLEDPVCRDLHERNVRLIENERRRLLYVAMTRARDRLYVTGFGSETKNPEQPSWYDLLKAGIERAGEAATDRDGRPVWRRERAQTAKIEEDPSGHAANGASPGAGEPTPPAWTRSAAPAEPLPSRPLAPSAPSGDEPAVRSPLGPAQAQAFARGRLMHRLFQYLPEVAPERRRGQAEVWLAQAARAFPATERDAMLQDVLGVLDDARFAPVFGPGSRAEVPLVGVVDGVAIAGQADRVVVRPDGIWVVDFKTHRPAPASVADVPDLYRHQMAAYGRILAAIYPDKPLKLFLLWTEGPTLMELP